MSTRTLGRCEPAVDVWSIAIFAVAGEIARVCLEIAMKIKSGLKAGLPRTGTIDIG